jgi:4-amino-4-deoxy-L-arabinose transferase-like glycosyltransferase
LLIAVIYLGRIGSFGLQDPDEGRYAEIPREMLELHDWTTPRLNYVKYFEKPPLLYWLVALSFRGFGISEWSSRLIPALAAIVTVCVTYQFGLRVLGSRPALLGTAILASSPLFFAFSQALVTDMLLTACTTLTFVFIFYAYLRDESQKLSCCLVASTSTALGVLTKGPIALLLPSIVAILFLAWRRNLGTVRAFLGWRPLLVFLLVSIPWFLLVSLRNPEFPRFFFVTQNIQRFTSDEVGHPGGFMYYLPVVLGGFFPWSCLALMLSVPSLRRPLLRPISRPELVYLALWAGVVVFFFSIAHTKLPSYILPAFPPLALLLGFYLDRLDKAGLLHPAVSWLDIVVVTLATTLLLASLVALAAPTFLATLSTNATSDVLSVAKSVAAFATVLLVSTALRRRLFTARQLGEPTKLVLQSATIMVALFLAIGGRAVTRTSQTIGEAITCRLAPGDLVATYRKVMQGLPFYTTARVVTVAIASELDFGASEADDRDAYFWYDSYRLAQEWNSPRHVFVATNEELLPELTKLVGEYPHVIADDGKRVAVANFLPENDASCPKRPPEPS